MPLVECVTGSGTTSAPKPMSGTKALNVPAALTNKVAAYTDDQGKMYLLAPVGWTCQATLGADGNDSIAVYPPGRWARRGLPSATAGRRRRRP